MQAEILRKLTIRNCGFSVANIKEAIEGIDEGESVELLKVVGKTTMAAKGQTDKGEYTALGGEFTAVNMLTGEVFTSAKCILPNFISEMIAAALAQSPQVEFGLLIGAKVDESSVTGYQFTTRPLIEAKPTESMLSLLNAAGIDPNAPRIEAPAKPAKEKKGPGRPPAKKSAGK
jgi:hypothetical protein